MWTALLDGKAVVFEVGDQSEEMFLVRYERLPMTQQYNTDDYDVYRWLPRNHHVEKFGNVKM